MAKEAVKEYYHRWGDLISGIRYSALNACRVICLHIVGAHFIYFHFTGMHFKLQPKKSSFTTRSHNSVNTAEGSSKNVHWGRPAKRLNT